MEPPIKSTRFHRIIIPITVMSAQSPSPKPSPLESTLRWQAVVVTLLALSQPTMMIDRALADDLASVFEVDITEIPCEIEDFPRFLAKYVAGHIKNESMENLMFRLCVVSERLGEMVDNMRMYG